MNEARERDKEMRDIVEAAEARAYELEALLADCATALKDCLQYIDGNPPHKVLPNIEWLCSLQRIVLAKLKATEVRP
jgi:hypothetical protein